MDEEFQYKQWNAWHKDGGIWIHVIGTCHSFEKNTLGKEKGVSDDNDILAIITGDQMEHPTSRLWSE